MEIDSGDNVLRQGLEICREVDWEVLDSGVYAANEFLLREFNEWVRARIEKQGVIQVDFALNRPDNRRVIVGRISDSQGGLTWDSQERLYLGTAT